MLKVKPPDGYPPEEGRYVRGNDYSPVAVCHEIASKLSQPQQDILQPGKSKLNMGFMLYKLLPRTSCRECGKRTCLSFAVDLAKGKCRLEECPILDQPEFAANRQALTKLLE